MTGFEASPVANKNPNQAAMFRCPSRHLRDFSFAAVCSFLVLFDPFGHTSGHTFGHRWGWRTDRNPVIQPCDQKCVHGVNGAMVVQFVMWYVFFGIFLTERWNARRRDAESETGKSVPHP